MDKALIDGEGLTLGDVERVVRGGAEVELSPATRGTPVGMTA
jgi:hypothetical protein